MSGGRVDAGAEYLARMADRRRRLAEAEALLNDPTGYGEALGRRITADAIRAAAAPPLPTDPAPVPTVEDTPNA